MSDFALPPDQEPTRLDLALARWSGLGLRRVRALIQLGAVTVDGRVRPKSTLIGPGQVVTWGEPDRPAPPQIRIEICRCEAGFAALIKPGGMHSVRGRAEPCLESCLPDLGLAGWRLVNRLDFLTSGLVLAAAGMPEHARYKGWQDRGEVDKYYLALAHGRVETQVVRTRIADDQRRVVRVGTEDDRPERWTAVWPVWPVGSGTLVLVGIRKGRRHQIRAHLASIGHALQGDPIYGLGEDGGLGLHHFRVEMPGFDAQCWPVWPWLRDTHFEAIQRTLSQVARQWPTGHEEER